MRVYWILLLSVLAAVPAFAEQPLSKLDIVILNPDGAESQDPGQRDPSSRAFCFLLARAVKEAIEKQNGTTVKVVFTASEDKPVNQKEHAFIANSNRGKVYISFHTAKGFPGEAPRGHGIYTVLSPDSGAPSWKDIGKRHAANSALLAGTLKAALETAFPSQQFFTGKGPLVSLYGVDMAAVAVELEPLSTPQASAPPSLEPLAAAIYTGLVEFDRRL